MFIVEVLCEMMENISKKKAEVELKQWILSIATK